jgi:hypothetical protein
VSGSISENAKVGALTVLINTNVSGSAQVYGVMWALDGKTVTGTAQCAVIWKIISAVR